MVNILHESDMVYFHQKNPKLCLKKKKKKALLLFLVFGKGSYECECVVALLWAKWEGGCAGWQHAIWYMWC